MRAKASYHQERLWFIHQFERGYLYQSGPVYHNIPLILEINGNLNINLLEKSLETILNRHEVLRTRMITIENEVLQQVESTTEFKPELLDPNAGNEEKTGKTPLDIAISESKRPFSFKDGLLIRAVLLKYSTLKHYLVITIHHLIADRCSLNIITSELINCYKALQEGRTPDLPELPLHYIDFSQWQRELPEDFTEELLFYWRRQLANLSPLQLPTRIPRAHVHTFREARGSFQLSRQLSREIRDFCAGRGCGYGTMLMAAFKILLYHYCRQEDIVIGNSVDNRSQPGTEFMVGPVDNLLVIRSQLSAVKTTESYLFELMQALEEARENAISFEQLALAINPKKDMSRTAFYDVLFQYDANPVNTSSTENLEINYIETNLGWGKNDLNLLVRDEENNFSGILVYNKDYYDQSFAHRFIGHYNTLLKSILENPRREIQQLDFLDVKERMELLFHWNQTNAAYPRQKTIHGLFEEQVEKRPDSAAVVFRDRVLTYRGLDTPANRVAAYLKDNRLPSGNLVGIMVERSEEMIAGLLGILKSGCAYVPISPQYPEERIRFMLKDSAIRVLIHSGTPLSKNYFADLELVELNAITNSTVEKSILPPAREGITNAENFAYTIYTSGTTGQPKGCLITHRNVVRLLMTNRLPFRFNKNDTWIMAHSYCFDFSVWEMYGPLFHGGKLVIPLLDSVRDVQRFHLLLERHAVTVLNQTPQAFYALVETEINSSS
ncbi:MAG: AMP-binding protein, partial [bacterium]|nr:AMP-binding protein [bacterium]